MDSPINLGPQTGRHRIFAPLSTVPSYSTSFFWLVLSIPLFHKSYPSCFPYSAVVTNIAFSLNLNRQTLKQSSNSQLTHGVRRALVCCPELTHAHSPAIKVQCVLTNQRLVKKLYCTESPPQFQASWNRQNEGDPGTAGHSAFPWWEFEEMALIIMQHLTVMQLNA